MKGNFYLVIIGLLLILCAYMFFNPVTKIETVTTTTEVQICNAGPQVLGFYDNLTGKIMLETKNLTPEEVKNNILHEYAHYLYQNEFGNNLYQVNGEEYAERYVLTHDIVNK